jgi:hypothetical protein
VQTVLVQLVDHEADDSLVVFGYHADTVALPQAANKVLFGPAELETAVFDLQNFGHVPPDHPADVNTNFLGCAGQHHFGAPSSTILNGITG